ncbi:hypothetical protein, partial [Stenotrophomonas maltophilia]|uniref:hypothetical protein n=1 Tax=Stenotrophomonas maltophilia TaxID=40324 RepID=UPI00313DB8BD
SFMVVYNLLTIVIVSSANFCFAVFLGGLFALGCGQMGFWGVFGVGGVVFVSGSRFVVVGSRLVVGGRRHSLQLQEAGGYLPDELCFEP